MGGKYDEVKEMFDKSDTYVTIDDLKKKEALKQINVCLKEHTVSASKSNWQLLKIQIYYMDKTILIVHLIACLGIILLGNWQYWEKISMAVSGALGALSLIEVGSMFFSRVTELEESCYFSVQQLVVFRMSYFGIISLATLLTVFMSAGLKYDQPVMKTGLYILVPFVFTECICMTVILTEMGRKNIMILVAAGIFSAFFWGILSTIPNLYEMSATAFWGVALIVGIGIFAIQVKRFFSELDKGEILCVN